MKTRGGRAVIAARRAKGRKRLAVWRQTFAGSVASRPAAAPHRSAASPRGWLHMQRLKTRAVPGRPRRCHRGAHSPLRTAPLRARRAGRGSPAACSPFERCLAGRHGFQALGPVARSPAQRDQTPDLHRERCRRRSRCRARRTWCACVRPFDRQQIRQARRPTQLKAAVRAELQQLLARAAGGARMMRRLLIGLVKGYRLLLSPWLGQSCRFEPTCSVYADRRARRARRGQGQLPRRCAASRAASRGARAATIQFPRRLQRRRRGSRVAVLALSLDDKKSSS